MKALRSIAVLFAAGFALALQAGQADAAIKTQYVDYKDGDAQLSGFLAYDDTKTGKRPGVLLAYYRGGFSGETFEEVNMIAKLGYVVFAEDVYGKGVLPKTVPDMVKQTAIYDGNRPLMRSRAQAGFDILRNNPMVDPAKLAVIGYCFGGTVAVELAQLGVPVLGTVTVHGSFRDFDPEAAKKIKGRVLILHGAEDPVAPMSEVNKYIDGMRAAKTDWELNVYSGTQHGFTAPQNPSEVRAKQEYEMATAHFFKEIFGS